MLATRQVPALEAAVAAEVAANILDVAIGRNRAPALDARHRYGYYKEREFDERRHLREGDFPMGREWHEQRYILYRNHRERAYIIYQRVFQGYREDRRWQNRRWGLAPRARYSALPPEARLLR